MGKMMILSGHWPEPAHLPEQPLQHLGASGEISRDKFAGLLGEIEEDRARFEQRYRLSTLCRLRIDDGGDAVIRRHS